jgi:hypothetical protein
MRVPRGHYPHRIAGRETALLLAKLETHTPDRRAATAWYAVQNCLRPFNDGTRRGTVKILALSLILLRSRGEEDSFAE